MLGEEDDASRTTWFWLTMNEQERDEKFSELSDWVETVLRAQYPDYLADQIRPCWPNHPEARWELAWLYQLVVACLPGRATHSEGRRRLARPLVPRRDPPPKRGHGPLPGNLPAAARPRIGRGSSTPSTAVILRHGREPLTVWAQIPRCLAWSSRSIAVSSLPWP